MLEAQTRAIRNLSQALKPMIFPCCNIEARGLSGAHALGPQREIWRFVQCPRCGKQHNTEPWRPPIMEQTKPKNPAAVALGKRAKGIKKNISDAERERRRLSAAHAREVAAKRREEAKQSLTPPPST